MRTSLTRRQITLLLITALILLALAFLVRDFVREQILKPLIDLGWMAWVGLMSLHQALIWGLFLIVALVILARAVFARPAGRRSTAALGEDAGESDPAALRGRSTIALPHYTVDSRYQFWRKSLDALPHSPFARERVARDLQQVVIAVLAEGLRSEPDKVRAQVARGELELDPALVPLFRGRRDPLEAFNSPHWWQRLFRRSQPRLKASDLNVEALVAWLEGQAGTTPPEADEPGP